MRLEDNEYQDHTITRVEKNADGSYDIGFDGMGFYCPGNSPIEPKVGMTARLYGKGLGARVRGLVIDGHEVYYRTEAEDKEANEIQLFGADAADWLKRWDEGRTVWSIEMGGLGPGYEQAIQVTIAELLRVMLDKGYDIAGWKDPDSDAYTWKQDREEIDKTAMATPVLSNLGLSGAQFGAAMNVATMLYMHGPRHIMNDDRVKDRHIQVSKDWPSAT